VAVGVATVAFDDCQTTRAPDGRTAAAVVTAAAAAAVAATVRTEFVGRSVVATYWSCAPVAEKTVVVFLRTPAA